MCLSSYFLFAQNYTNTLVFPSSALFKTSDTCTGVSSTRYTPYFFDKKLLDTILEESVDQHFHALIQTRRQHRDVFRDDDSDAELIDETGESMSEPPEV